MYQKLYTISAKTSELSTRTLNTCFYYTNGISLFVAASAPMQQDGEINYKDWVFINYTFKRFEGLTQRGTPTKK